MSLRRDEVLIEKGYEARPEWSLDALVAAARADGKLIEIIEVGRQGEDVVYRRVWGSALVVRSEAEVLERFRRLA